MGQTRRLYYRLDVAIDALAVRRPRELAPQPADEATAVSDAVQLPEDSAPGAVAVVAEPAPLGNGWTPLDHARILDISGSGIQLQARSTELAIGDQIVVAFVFGGHSYRLSTEVVWARHSQFAGAARAGLRFEGMATPERDALVREIYREQRGAARLRKR